MGTCRTPEGRQERKTVNNQVAKSDTAGLKTAKPQTFRRRDECFLMAFRYLTGEVGSRSTVEATSKTASDKTANPTDGGLSTAR